MESADMGQENKDAPHLAMMTYAWKMP